jgi:hypothetical protein
MSEPEEVKTFELSYKNDFGRIKRTILDLTKKHSKSKYSSNINAMDPDVNIISQLQQQYQLMLTNNETTLAKEIYDVLDIFINIPGEAHHWLMGLLTTGMVGDEELIDNSAFLNTTTNQTSNLTTVTTQESDTEYVEDFEEPDDASTPVNEEHINTDRREPSPSIAPSSTTSRAPSDDEGYGNDEFSNHKHENIQLKKYLNNVQGRLSEYRHVFNDPKTKKLLHTKLKNNGERKSNDGDKPKKKRNKHWKKNKNKN